MKKFTIAIAALSISVSSFAWGPSEQAGLIGLIAGGLIVNAVKDQPAQPPQYIIQQQIRPDYHPRYREPAPIIIEPNYNYQPPTYSPSTQIYTYTPPMVYDTRSRQWIPQAKIYVPANKHFSGCNFYIYEEARACIQHNESLLNGTYGR